MALLMVAFASLVLLGTTTLLVARLHNAKRLSDEALHRALVDESLRGAVDFGISKVWQGFIESQRILGLVGGFVTDQNLTAYRNFLDDRVVRDGQTASLLGEDEEFFVGQGRIDRLTVSRRDEGMATHLTIEASASVGPVASAAVQTVRVGGRPFDGLNFSMLTESTTCVFCHTQVLPVEITRGDLTPEDRIRRVKVASLQELVLRLQGPFAANSNIAGTLYIRGDVLNAQGQPLSAEDFARGTLKGYELQRGNDFLKLDENGNLIETVLKAAVEDADGILPQFANLYLDYPTDPAKMTDGIVPATFPAPFADQNKNRLVDDDEFLAVAQLARGRVSGGIAVDVPRGETFTGNSLPIDSSTTARAALSGGSIDGNLILIGTEENPIVFNPDAESGRESAFPRAVIAVNGDLAIKGVVKGAAQLFVRGNVYVLGDLVYDDAPGEFGEATDGVQNALAITPGGNILIGDFLTRRGKNNNGSDDVFDALFIDHRLPSKLAASDDGSRTVNVGYFADNVVDPGDAPDVDFTDPLFDEDITSFASSQMMLFNQREFERNQEDSGFRPRYYRLRPDAPVWRFEPLNTTERQYTVRYRDPLAHQIDPEELEGAGAAVLDLTPTGNWLSEDQLRRFWHEDQLTRPDSGRPLRVDALLYSNNAIFGIAHSKTLHNSNTFGQMEVRGALISPNLGLLTPGETARIPRGVGLSLFHDPRITEFVELDDPSDIRFERIVYRKARLEP